MAKKTAKRGSSKGSRQAGANRMKSNPFGKGASNSTGRSGPDGK